MVFMTSLSATGRPGVEESGNRGSRTEICSQARYPGAMADRGREAVWAVLTTVVLVVRMLATIALVLLAIGWAVAAVRDSMNNQFLWPAVITGTVLLLSTYLYSFLRARYPRRNGWIP
jgi:hypothetical protein